MKTRKAMEGRMREAGERMERPVRRAVTFLDEAIVPEVRRNSSVTPRAVSDRLRQLANQLDDYMGGDSQNDVRRRSAGSRC